ncbi:acetate/propionate family kinase [Planctomyces sp. SH-PL62]|uniref:acetate/propionate family kinase n=1 Tax=Planctomyces sp. SH-PL62 TaxID=1636152 RepID=UPI00078CCE22|nr:acetate/propionate family kinase [Planctomyces sp. SH-PL62]AMV38038.1 Acetate kinase [Planctomyces sp. SH-PL62]
MKVLVANLGSTSFKYRLFDMGDPAEPVLARGAIDRIGSPSSRVSVTTPKGTRESERPIADHGDAVQLCLEQLTDPEIGVLADASEVSAIGFKAVHARNLTGVHLVDDEVLEAMEAFADVAPAHNPPYTKAMRMLRGRFPKLPLVAAFETGFHRTIPEASQRYAIPEEWATTLGVRRWGFHGASHRYISWRTAELLGRKDVKVISCHLGGSSSLAAIRDGASVACSLGMSPQSGLPHNNRVGDFDVFALPALMRETGRSLEDLLDILANQSGLEGICGARDVRDVESAASTGDARAQLALDVFVASIRHHLGAFLLELGGADAIVFTGGIGENSSLIRSKTCRDLGWFGIELDPALNAGGPAERRISAENSRVQIWTVPTNEELVVARQSRELLESGRTAMA